LDKIPCYPSFCLTSFAQNTKVGLNHAVVVSKSKKYQDPLVIDYGLKSCLFSKMEVWGLQRRSPQVSPKISSPDRMQR